MTGSLLVAYIKDNNIFGNHHWDALVSVDIFSKSPLLCININMNPGSCDLPSAFIMTLPFPSRTLFQKQNRAPY